MCLVVNPIKNSLNPIVLMPTVFYFLIKSQSGPLHTIIQDILVPKGRGAFISRGVYFEGIRYSVYC